MVAAITNRFKNVYQPDQRWGDGLIKPQRWCNRQWQEICLPLVGCRYPKLEVVRRIACLIPFVILSLGARFIAIVGVCLKASQAQPPLARPAAAPAAVLPVVPVARAPIPPIGLGELPIQSRELFQVTSPGDITPALEFDPILLQNPWRVGGLGPFDPKGPLPLDMKVFILSNLSKTDLLSFRLVSRHASALATADFIWDRFLQANRVMGPVRNWKFEQVREGARGLSLAPEPGRSEIAPPYEQLKTYRELVKSRGTKDYPDFFCYLARLNRGGPVAFKNLPQLELGSISGIQLPGTPREPIRGVLPEHMTASVMVGTHRNQDFIAFRMLDKSSPDNKPFVVLLLKLDSPTWVHAASGPWGENEIKVTDQDHANYMVRIMKGEKHWRLPEGFKSTIDLV